MSISLKRIILFVSVIISFLEKIIPAWMTGTTSHIVECSDGWKLKSFRMNKEEDSRLSTPVLLWHGLSTCSDIFMGKGLLAEYLTLRGLDCWLGNSRGNKFTKFRDGSQSNWNFRQLIWTNLQLGSRSRGRNRNRQLYFESHRREIRNLHRFLAGGCNRSSSSFRKSHLKQTDRTLHRSRASHEATVDLSLLPPFHTILSWCIIHTHRCACLEVSGCEQAHCSLGYAERARLET